MLSQILTLLTRNLPFDVRQVKSSFNHIVCGAKPKNRTRGQFECDVTWFCFYFDFVRSHALYHLERRRVGGRLKLDVQGQGGGSTLDADGQEGEGS